MYQPGAIVVIRGGTDVAGRGGPGQARAPSLAKVVSVDGGAAVVQRSRGYGRNHWSKAIDVPRDAIVRLATPREHTLGYPAPEGPPLRPVSL